MNDEILIFISLIISGLITVSITLILLKVKKLDKWLIRLKYQYSLILLFELLLFTFLYFLILIIGNYPFPEL